MNCTDPVTGEPCRHPHDVYDGCICAHCRADAEGGELHVQFQDRAEVNDYLLDFLEALYKL